MKNILNASIQLARNPKTGVVKMLDLLEVQWVVYHKDGSNPTEAEFNTMLAENWGWFDFNTKVYDLKRVEAV